MKASPTAPAVGVSLDTYGHLIEGADDAAARAIEGMLKGGYRVDFRSQYCGGSFGGPGRFSRLQS